MNKILKKKRSYIITHFGELTYEPMIQSSSYDKKIGNKNKFIKNSLKLITSEEYFNSYYLIKKTKTMIIEKEKKEIQKQLSKYFIYNTLYTLKNLNIDFNKKIYLPFFFDFRGRFYYNSLVGPTNLKYVRYAINYGVIDGENFKIDKKN
jgi:hypothetical protein